MSPRKDPARIAVAVDPAGSWWAPLRYASFLASSWGADLVLLPVDAPCGPNPAAGSESIDGLRKAALSLSSVPVRVGHSPLPSVTTTLASDGRSGTSKPNASDTDGSKTVDEVILAEAARHGANLIVMQRGVEWSGGLYLLASVAERVAARARVPVLSVARDGPAPRLRTSPRIVVLGVGAGRSAPCLAWAASLAAQLEGDVVRAKLEHLVTPGARVAEVADRLEADVVVAAATDGGGKRGVLSLVASAAVRSLDCPVLVVPPERGTAEPARKRTARRGAFPTARRWSLRTRGIHPTRTDPRASVR